MKNITIKINTLIGLCLLIFSFNYAKADCPGYTGQDSHCLALENNTQIPIVTKVVQNNCDGSSSKGFDNITINPNTQPNGNTPYYNYQFGYNGGGCSTPGTSSMRIEFHNTTESGALLGSVDYTYGTGGNMTEVQHTVESKFMILINPGGFTTTICDNSNPHGPCEYCPYDDGSGNNNDSCIKIHNLTTQPILPVVGWQNCTDATYHNFEALTIPSGAYYQNAIRDNTNTFDGCDSDSTNRGMYLDLYIGSISPQNMIGTIKYNYSEEDASGVHLEQFVDTTYASPSNANIKIDLTDSVDGGSSHHSTATITDTLNPQK